MQRLAIGLFALAILAPGISFADEKTEDVKTHEMDGKKTTHTKKVKRTADGKGNSEVKTETVQKTEVGKANGSGDEKLESSSTHETDGKKTTRIKKVQHSDDGKGNNEVKSESTKKTEVSKP